MSVIIRAIRPSESDSAIRLQHQRIDSVLNLYAKDIPSDISRKIEGSPMTHLYSRGIEYALRCLQLMAQNPAIPRTVVELCEEAQLPEHFTRKMLQPLVRAGYLKSNRGPGGGFVFAVPPEEITLKNVVEGIEGKSRKKYCLLGGTAPPPLQDRWSEIWDLSEKLLETTTVADLIKGWDGTDRLEEAGIVDAMASTVIDNPESDDRGRRYLPRS